MGKVGKAIRATIAAAFILHGLAGPAGTQEHGHDDAVTQPATPSVHVEKMKAGNENFVRLHGREYRLVHSKGQQPSLIVMQCADSRDDLVTQAQLPPGYAFEMGVNAGNIINTEEASLVANIIYHLKHLKGQNRAYVVMGHYGCGGIKGLDEWEHLEPEIAKHLRLALPAKEFVEKQLRNRRLNVSEETRHRMIVEANVLAQIRNLMSIQQVRSAVEQRHLAVMPVISDINTGELHFGLPTLQQHGLLEHAKAEFGIQKWLQGQHRLQDQQLARLGPFRPQDRRMPAESRNFPKTRVRPTAFRRK
ncbi:carbonic anhydrase [Candidatus Micrarchaeota archaeon]|nr:carbonic anhydrase [Candidatus Micrarchaeota archaeon]